jgi:hypothetical protein
MPRLGTGGRTARPAVSSRLPSTATPATSSLTRQTATPRLSTPRRRATREVSPDVRHSNPQTGEQLAFPGLAPRTAARSRPSAAAGESNTIERSVLYLNREHRTRWEKVCAIAREAGGDEAEARELLRRAATLALEQHRARAAGERS